MNDGHNYTVDAARNAAKENALGPWVAQFLSSEGSDNAVLGEQLLKDRQGWTGPMKLPIDQLNRLAGPPGDPVLTPIDDADYWRDDVDDMREKIESGWEPPPVIVTYRNDQLVLEDGNHRVESLRRAGRDEAWAIVGFEDERDRDKFTSTNPT